MDTRQPTATRQPAITVTSVNDVDHEAALSDMAAGVEAGDGRYRALCGAMFLSAPLVTPSGRSCPGCVAYLRAARSRARDAMARPSAGRHRIAVPTKRHRARHRAARVSIADVAIADQIPAGRFRLRWTGA